MLINMITYHIYVVSFFNAFIESLIQIKNLDLVILTQKRINFFNAKDLISTIDPQKVDANIKFSCQ